MRFEVFYHKIRCYEVVLKGCRLDASGAKCHGGLPKTHNTIIPHWITNPQPLSMQNALKFQSASVSNKSS